MSPMSLLVALIIIVIAGSGADNQEPASIHGKRAVSAHMANEKWSGGFVDTNDAQAMRRWAQNMCHGLDLEKTAKALDVPPTRSAVANKLIGNPTDDLFMREKLVGICETELKKANKNK